MGGQSAALIEFRRRVVAVARARLERDGLSEADLGRKLGWDANMTFRALNPGHRSPAGLPYGDVAADRLFELVDWLGEDAADLIRPRVTTTWREVEDAIEALADPCFTKAERLEMIGHLRLVRAGSLRRERERDGRI